MKAVTRIIAAVSALLLASSVAFAGERVTEDLIRNIKEGTTWRTGQFEIGLHGRVQTWGGWVDGATLLENGDMMQESGFRLRRARLGVAGQLFDGLTYEIELDLFDQERSGGPLYDAYLNWSPTPYIGVSVGVDKMAFSYGDAMSSARLANLDRSLAVYAMSPGSPLGLTLHSEPWVDHLRISFGVYNGLERKRSFHGGFEGVGVSLGNRYERVSFAGRVDLEPLAPIGPCEADMLGTSDFRLLVGGGVMYNHSDTITNLYATGTLHMKVAGFHFLSEVYWGNDEPEAQPSTENTLAASLDRLAFYASLGYMILPRHLGIAARFDWLDDNMDVDDEGDEWLASATLTWYEVAHHLKAQVSYQFRKQMNGLKLDSHAAIAGIQIYF